MKRDIMTLDDATIERAFGDILIAPSMTPAMAACTTPSRPRLRSVERLVEPRELIDPLDRIELELELGIPDRGSLVRRVADLLAGDGAPPAEPDSVAKVVGLAAALASRLHFDGAGPCHLEPDDAEAIGLGVAEFQAANFGIRAAAALPSILADNAGPYALVPAPADTALFVATAAHYRIGMAAPAIGIIVRLLIRLLRLLWQLIRNLLRLRKRVAAGNRLQTRWAADVAAGTMTRAQYIAKLGGLIATLSVEIDAVAALIAAVVNEIRTAEGELEGIEDADAKRAAEDALRELRERLEELRRLKESLEQQQRDAQSERDAAQRQEGGG